MKSLVMKLRDRVASLQLKVDQLQIDKEALKYVNLGGDNLRPVILPASTSVNTPAEGSQRFHLRTESLWIPVTNAGRTPPITPTWAFKP